MPVDSGGNITRPSNPIPVSGQDADAPQVNVPIDDIYAALNMLLFLDGRKALRGNIPMNGYRASGAGDAESADEYVTLSQVTTMIASISAVPTGLGPLPMTGTAAPLGWVRANGQALSRSAYPALWSYVQASGNLASSEGEKTLAQYGPGDGSTTFTVPNVEADGGYFIRSVASGRGVGTVQADAFKSHDHGGETSAGGDHDHGYLQNTNLADSIQPGGAGRQYSRYQSAAQTSGAPAHTHGISAQGGTETRPKNLGYIFIIKA